ncbi:hypothetical protein ACVDG5_036520 [Mesorhizobium sp. ORM6]
MLSFPKIAQIGANAGLHCLASDDSIVWLRSARAGVRKPCHFGSRTNQRAVSAAFTRPGEEFATAHDAWVAVVGLIMSDENVTSITTPDGRIITPEELNALAKAVVH